MALRSRRAPPRTHACANITHAPLQNRILSAISGAPFRIEVEFLDGEGKPYAPTTTVKNKREEEEVVPVYANKDTVRGQVRARARARAGLHARDALIPRVRARVCAHARAHTPPCIG